MRISHRRETAGRQVKPGCPAGTVRSDKVIASSGVTFHLWRLYHQAWLACLLFPLVSLVREPGAPGHLVLGLVALGWYAVSYTWLMWPHPVHWATQARTRSWRARLLWMVLIVLALVFSLAYGSAWLWLFIGVAAIAGVLLPMRAAFAAVAILMFVPVVVVVGTTGGIGGIMNVDWRWPIALLLLVRGLGLDMIGMARMGSAIRELHTTRRELARLQVEEERLRLARDLHDLLGQTLSMITLKSELARHLVTEEPDRCVQELAEIEHVARQTLCEVREAVAGYRQPQLSSELEGARQLLEAAGIDVRLEPLSETLPPEVSAVLAWTVREGVTNVIRHSRAQHCLIRLTQQHGRISAEVINDGGNQERVESVPVRPGLGLAGLHERVSALGGRMEAGPLDATGKEGFRVQVDLPLQSRGERQVFPGSQEEPS
jgi:two-component system, NarL family, sensor histidine kinase DesK